MKKRETMVVLFLTNLTNAIPCVASKLHVTEHVEDATRSPVFLYIGTR